MLLLLLFLLLLRLHRRLRLQLLLLLLLVLLLLLLRTLPQLVTTVMHCDYNSSCSINEESHNYCWLRTPTAIVIIIITVVLGTRDEPMLLWTATTCPRLAAQPWFS